jgi:diacylglycerol kinase (ATP)
LGVPDSARKFLNIHLKKQPIASIEGAMKRAEPAMVFVNPAAGSGRAKRTISAAREAFARRSYSVEFVETGSREDLQSSIRAAADQGCAAMIAMGGDGTLQLLVREVIARNVTVGVIPTGGGNDFAAALGIRGNLQKAIETIVAGRTRLVDVVNVHFSSGDDALYLGGGGIGLDAEAARYAGGRFLNWPGRLRYLASAIAALRGFAGVELRAEFSEDDLPKIERRVLLAAALNTPTYGGGLRLAPEARLEDGKLEVILIEMLKKREVLALIPRLLVTGELRTKRVARYRTEAVKFSASGEAWFQGDGELLGKSPVEIRVKPKALRMLAP